MKLDALNRFLNSFGKQVVKQAKENLSAADKKGALADSIDFFVIRKGGSITVRFKMFTYGKFVDKGVSGNKVKRSYKDYKGKTRTSPFKFTTKQPPTRVLDKWIVKKGIAPRDAKGRFMSRKSISFLIARSIKKKGIQGISFFQKPLMLGMKQFNSNFGKAIGEDILKSLRQQKIA